MDPPGCKDIDDALHSRQLPNGNVELGVHIADVSHFVRPDSAIDKEAAFRSTTVYLVDRRTDMLPGLLTENLCSLRGGVERLAFSVVWEMDPKTAKVGPSHPDTEHQVPQVGDQVQEGFHVQGGPRDD